MISQDFHEHAEDVLAFVVAQHAAGTPCCLGVITDVSGGSARSVATLFAVTDRGHMAGYVSNGCVDADVVAQAQGALSDGRPRALVYGAGSPFMDLRLPCGGTVELRLDPAPNAEICVSALDQLTARRAVSLQFDRQGALVGLGGGPTGWDADIFTARHIPRLRLVVAGMGAPIYALARAANALDIPCVTASPEAGDAERIVAAGAEAHVHLRSPDAPPELALDDATAMLLMFHAHDWEPQILAHALTSDAFYIGALGSAQTQDRRLETLTDLGVPKAALSRIKGPIGVLPSARDAGTLAISSLAEIIGVYRAMVARDSTRA